MAEGDEDDRGGLPQGVARRMVRAEPGADQGGQPPATHGGAASRHVLGLTKKRVEDILEWDPDKVDEAPRMPSPFEKYMNRESDGFQVVEPDIPSVTGQQRREALEEMIPRLLEKAGIPGTKLIERITYLPDRFTGATVSKVRFKVAIPGAPDELFIFNVPPFGDWSREVMIVVLDYLWAWAHERKVV